jgi:hypothetical protein
MADFLAKMDKALAKSQAREHGDRFAVFAAVCKAKTVWLAAGPSHTDIRQAVQYSLAEGRDQYRKLIVEARAATRERLPARPRALV